MFKPAMSMNTFSLTEAATGPTSSRFNLNSEAERL